MTINDSKNNGAVAQLGERLDGIQKVVGSIPSSSTIGKNVRNKSTFYTFFFVLIFILYKQSFSNDLFKLTIPNENYRSEEQKINEVLNEVGLFDIEKKYPFELSGGEQQRTAIARALLNTPELIIADEPTGNLDPQTSNEIMEVFKKLHNQGMSVFMATHDYNMIVKFPGKIFKCDSGKVFEVIAKPKVNDKE